MEIGRKPLTDNEFNMLWARLYKEFFELASTGSCDASEVYAMIYRVCTSVVPYEDKLYWKIGDFLYNRCREHRLQIEGAEDYIGAYAQSFAGYSHMVEAINKLSSFLNECVRGRRVDIFGYLLWERSVIQSMPATFYDDVYEYGGDSGDKSGHAAVRRVILDSFARVVPDAFTPLLYYREKYEKLALGKLEQKYRAIYETEDIEKYAELFYQIAARERRRANDYFLPESSDKYERILSSCLLANADVIAERMMACFIGSNLPSEFIGRQTNTDSINGTSDFVGTEINAIPPISHINDALKVLAPLINKANRKLGDYLGQIDGVSNTNRYCRIVRQLAILDKGYTIAKKGYALFVLEMVNRESRMLCGDIESVSRLFASLDVLKADDEEMERCVGVPRVENGEHDGMDELCSVSFNRLGALKNEGKAILFGTALAANALIHSDFREILVTVIKLALQRVKPCFIERICMATDAIVRCGEDCGWCRGVAWKEDERVHWERREKEEKGGDGSLERGPEPRPIVDLIEEVILRDNQIPKEVAERLSLMHELVADKAELMNVYQATLRKRLLCRESCLGMEMAVLKALRVGEEDQLWKMVQDVLGNRAHLKEENKRLTLLNGSFWGFETDSTELKVPEALMAAISESQGGRINSEQFEIAEKIVKFVHEFSTVTFALSGRVIRANIMQYAVIDALRRPASIDALGTTLRLKDRTLRGILEVLVSQGIAVRRGSLFALRPDASAGPPLDLSVIREQTVQNNDYCRASHLQAAIARIMKARRTIQADALLSEASVFLGDTSSHALISEAIEALVDKGLIEHVGNILEYSL